jgi:hypothetical protein
MLSWNAPAAAWREPAAHHRRCFCHRCCYHAHLWQQASHPSALLLLVLRLLLVFGLLL